MRINKDEFIKMLDSIKGDYFELYVYDNEYGEKDIELGSGKIMGIDGNFIEIGVN